MIAIIPARGGSKGLPGKNIKYLNGKPLIAYTIEAAISSKIFAEVIVSTDDEEIEKVSLSYGAKVPFKRPAHLAKDETASDEAILHALEFYKENNTTFKRVCKLQPTSPLRTCEMIVEAYNLLVSEKKDFLVSVCECEHTPLWSNVLDENNSLDNFIENEDVKRLCRQQLDTYYRLNGAIYMANTNKFIENKNFLGKNGIAYIMKQRNSIDIDSELDFKFTEYLLGENRYE